MDRSSRVRRRRGGRIAEIERLIPESEGKNHFELLHVERASDLKAIKKSYFAFARRYHPDKFFSVGSEDTRRRIDALYTRLTVAFETLKDGKRREEYEASLDAPPAERAERQGDVIRAEIQFGEAQVALQQRDFAKAKDAVAWSLRLNPEKGKYHALLGRILTESKEYDAAVAAFEKAAELEPKQALHRFLAGRALLQKGSTAEAKRLFQIAIAVDPGCHEAKRELRLLEMRGGAGPATQARPGVSKSERAEHDEKKKGGLFGKLLGKG
ncbi:MAG: tetratricopeptide repeat protein [Acidobacteriota bacterium]